MTLVDTFVDCPGWLTRERVIVDQIEEMLPVEYDLPPESDRELYEAEFEKFEEWADRQGLLSLPASGHVVAAYLMDLVLMSEASLDDIATAAAAIKFSHEMARQYLDWAPIHAALDFAIEELTE